LLAFAAAIVGSSFLAGCTVHAGYYDPYYRDRHTWVVEQPYYSRWEADTHRRHEEFRHRKRQEQHEYWEWRHHQH
jgi:hypothetical protein